MKVDNNTNIKKDNLEIESPETDDFLIQIDKFKSSQEKKAEKIKTFYFFCSPLPDFEYNPDANTDYQHCIISLAEGLTALGYACYGNIDYWEYMEEEEIENSSYSENKHIKGEASDMEEASFFSDNSNSNELAIENKNYLIKEKPLSAVSSVEAVIVSGHWFKTKEKLPITPSNVPIILIADMQTELHNLLQNRYLSWFSTILLCGYMKCYNYPKNVRPWAFGLTNRIIHATSDTPVMFSERKKSMIFNFRMWHTSRILAEKHLAPSLNTIFEIDREYDNLTIDSYYEKIMAIQTGMRHYTQYYQKLQNSQAVAAFGGYFATAITKSQFGLLNRFFSKLVRVFQMSSSVLVQHDSWRFWEGLAAGAVVFHADFDKCNVVYPQQPVEGIHYIGVHPRFFAPHNHDYFLQSIPKENLSIVAGQGKQFVLEHYAPIPVANRFLNIIHGFI